MLGAPAMILVGGLVFGALAPLLGGLAGAIAVSALTAAAASAASAGVSAAVDRSVRLVLERAQRRDIPAARVLRDGSAALAGGRPAALPQGRGG